MKKIAAIPAQIGELLSEVAQLKNQVTALAEALTEIRKETAFRSDVSNWMTKSIYCWAIALL